MQILPPTFDKLDAYEAALASGWSPHTGRNVSAEQLASLRRDRAAFLAWLLAQDGEIRLDDGQVVPRMPSRLFWLWDGDFCGRIELRFQPGTEALPPTCSGHVGYAVVPEQRGRGYAKRALELLLPVAAGVGLKRVQITCDVDNTASRRVIEANGGLSAGEAPYNGVPKLIFWVPTWQTARELAGSVACG